MQVAVGDALDFGGGEPLRKKRVEQRGQIGRVSEVLRIALHAVEVRADADVPDARDRGGVGDMPHDVPDLRMPGRAKLRSVKVDPDDAAFLCDTSNAMPSRFISLRISFPASVRPRRRLPCAAPASSLSEFQVNVMARTPSRYRSRRIDGDAPKASAPSTVSTVAICPLRGSKSFVSGTRSGCVSSIV